MNSIDTECTVCINLFYGIFDTLFFELCNFLVVEYVERFVPPASFAANGFGNSQCLEIILESSLSITQPFLESAMLMVAA